MCMLFELEVVERLEAVFRSQREEKMERLKEMDCQENMAVYERVKRKESLQEGGKATNI